MISSANKFIHAVEISAEAKFDYEQVIFDNRRYLLSWEDYLEIVCGGDGIKAAEEIRQNKKEVYRAQNNLTRYLRKNEIKDCAVIDEYENKIRRAQTATAELERKRRPLHAETFQYLESKSEDEPPLRTINAREIASYCADYLTELERRGQINEYAAYVRVEYHNDLLNADLLLFLTRKERLANMIFWEVRTVCVDDEWTWELEDNGVIREMIKDRLPNLSEPIITDFAVAERIKRVLRATEKLTFAEVLEETLNEFEFENDKRMATDILHAKKYLCVGGDERLIRRTKEVRGDCGRAQRKGQTKRPQNT